MKFYGCSEAGQVATRHTAHTEEWTCFEGITLRQDIQGTWAMGEAVGPDTRLNDVIELETPSRFLLHGRTLPISSMLRVSAARSPT